MRKLSAELNSLFRYYDEVGWPTSLSSEVILLASDTEISKAIAEIYQKFLRGILKIRTSWKVIENLTTASGKDFSIAMREFFPAIMREIERYKLEGFKVVINLTAGFKPLQAYMTILGMLFADEMFYIFEGSNELIRMPRLPIELRVDIDKHGWKLALLVDGTEEADIPSHYFSDIPDLYYRVEGNIVYPSELAQRLWANFRDEFLSKRELPKLPLIDYSSSFSDQFSKLKKEKRKKVLRELVKLSAVLMGTALEDIEEELLNRPEISKPSEEELLYYIWVDKNTLLEGALEGNRLRLLKVVRKV